MWLRVPEKITDVLWEGAVEPASEDLVQEVNRGGEKSRISDKVARELPVVSIGRPEVWNLSDVIPESEMPKTLKVKLAEADFSLVRLACSFRPRSQKHTFKWARFVVELQAAGAEEQPVAYDLHPQFITQEVQRKVGITLTPMLKFKEVEANLAGVNFGFEYTELQPIISAAGFGETIVSWDFEATKGISIQGAKWMHLLLKRPLAQREVHAFLDLSADVSFQRSVLSVLAIKQREKVREQLKVRLV